MERLSGASGTGPTGERAPITWQTGRVARVQMESPHARTLCFELPTWFGHKPGQYLDVRLTAPDGYQAQRSFSIGSAPEDEHVEITVERIEDGEVSPYLVDVVEEGDELELRGPIGGPFTWDVHDGGPLLLVGGGSGFVPLMSMLRHRRAQASEIETRALISVRRPADALYPDEIAALAGPGLDARWTYTRGAPDGWAGFSGRVTGEMLTELGPPADAAPRAFVCGPTPFVEHVAALLVAAGHDPLLVHTERFGPTGPSA